MSFSPEKGIEKKIAAGEASTLEIGYLDLIYRARQVLRKLRKPAEKPELKPAKTPRNAWLGL
jgi:hypothetical protein